METNYFQKLSEIQCEVEKKNGLNYISWSDAWAEVKKIHPEATYKKIMNELDNTFLFHSGTGGMVLCEVTINGISHTADLAITDFKNQEIPYQNIKSTDIQNTTQRTFAKAIALHGIGLYVYRGEDFPNEDHEKAPAKSKTPTPALEFIKSENIDALLKNIAEGTILCPSSDDAIALAKTKYKVAQWAETEIREKGKSIFI